MRKPGWDRKFCIADRIFICLGLFRLPSWMNRPAKRRKTSSSTSQATPLRRSARLAGGQASSLAGEHVAQADNDTTNHPSPITGSPEPSTEPDEEHYSMELAIRPPRRIAVGVKLETPLVVTFSAPRLRKKAFVPGELRDLSGVWAFVSLMTEDRSRSLAPPQTDLLRGHMADSVHPITHDDGREEQPFAYATFPSLEITRPGRYCFRVNIIDMNQPYTPEARNGSAKVLPALHSEIFDVVESGRHSGQDTRARETIHDLRARGANV